MPNASLLVKYSCHFVKTYVASILIKKVVASLTKLITATKCITISNTNSNRRKFIDKYSYFILCHSIVIIAINSINLNDNMPSSLAPVFLPYHIWY